jgi:hypothetical protein
VCPRGAAAARRRRRRRRRSLRLKLLIRPLARVALPVLPRRAPSVSAPSARSPARWFPRYELLTIQRLLKPQSNRPPQNCGIYRTRAPEFLKPLRFSGHFICFSSRISGFDTCLDARMSNSNVTVCVRFRPLSHKERKGNGDEICFKKLDSGSFVLKVWTLFRL